MNGRFLPIFLSLGAAVFATSMDALAQRSYGNEGGGMRSGAMPGYGTPGQQRSYEAVPGSGPEDRRTAQEVVQQNPKLADSLSKLLPAGTDVQAAASGFRNARDFAAAVHASTNLGIPFADVKTKMLAGASLDKVIQALKPDVDGLIEARKARGQAEELLGG